MPQQDLPPVSITKCASEARSAVQPPEMTAKEWAYYKAAIGWKCAAEVERTKRDAANTKLAHAEDTITLAKAIVAAPPPPAEGWSDLDMGLGIGVALVLGALATALGVAVTNKD